MLVCVQLSDEFQVPPDPCFCSMQLGNFKNQCLVKNPFGTFSGRQPFHAQISDFKGLGSVFFEDCDLGVWLKQVWSLKIVERALWNRAQTLFDQQSSVCTIHVTSCQKLLQTISAETLGQKINKNHTMIAEKVLNYTVCWQLGVVFVMPCHASTTIQTPCTVKAQGTAVRSRQEHIKLSQSLASFIWLKDSNSES